MKNYGPIIRNATEILHGGDYNPDQWLETPEIIDRDFELMECASPPAWTTFY